MWKKKKRKVQFAFNAEKVFLAATQPLGSVFSYFQTSRFGLTAEEVEKRQSLYGKNEVEHEQRKNPVSTFVKAFINPFIGVLTGLVIVSFVLDVLLADPGEQDWTAIVIISTMVIVSAILRFWQEWRAEVSSGALLRMVTNTCYVKRAGNHDEEINIAELVPGDVVVIAAGDMIPADIRIIEAKDLFVSQSALTGESDPIEKHSGVRGKNTVRGVWSNWTISVIWVLMSSAVRLQASFLLRVTTLIWVLSPRALPAIVRLRLLTRVSARSACCLSVSCWS